MSKTSTEVKNRWIKKAYKRYLINLRRDRDKELIDFMDAMAESGHSATDTIKQALELLIKEKK